jgi:hypothetical protein
MPTMELDIASVLAMISNITAFSESQTGGPYRADQSVLPIGLPYGVPRESNLEARASPAVVASPLVPVSLGMRGPTALSQSTGAELVKLTVQTPNLVIDDKTDNRPCKRKPSCETC